jgi:hypothetical protein
MMMRSGLAAVVVTLIGLGGAGCKSKSIAECDTYLAHAEKIASCAKIPETTRGTLKTVVKEMRDRLGQADLDNAPDELIDMLRKTCASTDKTLVDQYNKLLPECLK